MLSLTWASSHFSTSYTASSLVTASIFSFCPSLTFLWLDLVSWTL